MVAQVLLVGAAGHVLFGERLSAWQRLALMAAACGFAMKGLGAATESVARATHHPVSALGAALGAAMLFSTRVLVIRSLARAGVSPLSQAIVLNLTLGAWGAVAVVCTLL